MSNFWKAAGMSYLQFVNVSARALRVCLRVSHLYSFIHLFLYSFLSFFSPFFLAFFRDLLIGHLLIVDLFIIFVDFYWFDISLIDLTWTSSLFLIYNLPYIKISIYMPYLTNTNTKTNTNRKNKQIILK